MSGIFFDRAHSRLLVSTSQSYAEKHRRPTHLLRTWHGYGTMNDTAYPTPTGRQYRPKWAWVPVYRWGSDLGGPACRHKSATTGTA